MDKRGYDAIERIAYFGLTAGVLYTITTAVLAML